MINIRWVIGTTVGSPLIISAAYYTYKEWHRQPDFCLVGWMGAVALWSAIISLCFYMFMGLNNRDAGLGVAFFAPGAVLMDLFGYPWSHGAFMQIPTYSIFVGFICLMAEVGDMDVSEVTIRNTRD